MKHVSAGQSTPSCIRRGCRPWLLLSLLLLLGGCRTLSPYPPGAPQGEPAPVVHGQAATATTPAPAPDVYQVRPGDTLAGIGRRYGMNYRDIARWNDLAPPYTIFPGDRLRLSAAGGAVSPRPRQPLAEEPLVRQPDPGPAAVMADTPAVAPSNPGSGEAVPGSPATGLSDWIWPAQGVLLRTFAASRDGKQGINIGGQPGSPVWAAGDGSVVYSGDGLVGYGNLVILSHQDGVITAYGYNSALLVQEGDRVRQGDPIALMGAHGGVPMLHFELRLDGRSVDPIGYLPAMP